MHLENASMLFSAEVSLVRQVGLFSVPSHWQGKSGLRGGAQVIAADRLRSRLLRSFVVLRGIACPQLTRAMAVEGKGCGGSQEVGRAVHGGPLQSLDASVVAQGRKHLPPDGAFAFAGRRVYSFTVRPQPIRNRGWFRVGFWCSFWCH